MKQLDTIMQREMTRKEFLGAIGLGVVTIFGFSSILRYLFGKSQAPPSSYGSGTYGGPAPGAKISNSKLREGNNGFAYR